MPVNYLDYYFAYITIPMALVVAGDVLVFYRHASKIYRLGLIAALIMLICSLTFMFAVSHGGPGEIYDYYITILFSPQNALAVRSWSEVHYSALTVIAVVQYLLSPFVILGSIVVLFRAATK